MKRRTIVGICLFSCFLIVSMPLIPSVQSIEVKKEVKSVINEKIEMIKSYSFGIFSFIFLYYILCYIITFYDLLIYGLYYVERNDALYEDIVKSSAILSIFFTFVTMYYIPYYLIHNSMDFLKDIITHPFLFILNVIDFIIQLLVYLTHPIMLINKISDIISEITDVISVLIKAFATLFVIIIEWLWDTITPSNQANIT